MDEMELFEKLGETVADTSVKTFAQTLGKSAGNRLLQVLTHFGTRFQKPFQRQIEHKNDEDIDVPKDQKVTNNATTENVPKTPKIDPEYAEQVVTQGLGWTFQQVDNINIIVKDTAQSLLNNPPQEDVNVDELSEDISVDWLNEFRSVACKKSTKETRALFSKVLEGEIRKPGSISLLALTTLANMDPKIATLFNKFCSLCLVNLDKLDDFLNSPSNFRIHDARIPILTGSIMDVDTSRNFNPSLDENFIERSESIYEEYGFGFDASQLLMEYALIDNTTSMNYNHFWYNNELWGMLQPSTNEPDTPDDYQTIRLSGYALTTVGKELFHITKLYTPPQYWDNISDFLQDYYNVKLINISKNMESSPDVSINQNTPQQND